MIGRIEFKILPHLTRMHQLRSDVRTSLQRHGVRAERLEVLVLVVDEIVTNAIEHGSRYRRADDELTLRFHVEGTALAVEFIDPSATKEVYRELVALLDQCRNGPPPLHSERGRGLFLVQDGLDEFEIEMLGSGTGLSMRGRLESR